MIQPFCIMMLPRSQPADVRPSDGKDIAPAILSVASAVASAAEGAAGDAHPPANAEINKTTVVTVQHESLQSPAKKLHIFSYNMHGFNQGSHTVRDIVFQLKPDIFMIQEHWLTPANLSKLNDNFPQYLCFGTSAMGSSVESGVLYGRPFGGVAMLVNKQLQRYTKLLFASDRYVLVTVGNLLIVNVYLPCVGTDNRLCIVEDILCAISDWLDKNSSNTVLFGGDFNVDLDKHDPVSDLINCFCSDNCLHRCDLILSTGIRHSTYINESLGHESVIDYFFISDSSVMSEFEVVDKFINLSDHLPLSVKCMSKISICHQDVSAETNSMSVYNLRWDHADLSLYREATGCYLPQFLHDLSDLEKNDCVNIETIDCLYRRLVDILSFCSEMTVPKHKKNFFKYWWDQELDALKDQSMSSCSIWRAAGRPRSGPLFDKYRKDKSAYRRAIRLKQQDETNSYTNDLHEALLRKQGTTFWKCWNSKFGEKRRLVNTVNGLTDHNIIAENFATYFSRVCSNTTVARAAKLRSEYETMRTTYAGFPTDASFRFDAELVESVINNMKLGKAAGLDGLTVEHLRYCDNSLPGILAKLFNVMLYTGCVPTDFGLSFTVPILKNNLNACCKSVTVEDFRGISISPVISKILEHCILDRYKNFFISSDNQFGFKKKSSCSHAIYSLRCVVDSYVKNGSTVNICALDLSKAFDKMNHHGLFIRLMQRHLPINVLCILENWFSICATCVKWGNLFSRLFTLSCGIRQGGVLSPYLFAIYIDNLVDRIRNCPFGCFIKNVCMSILLYADDILLVAPSVTSLQKLLYICEDELTYIDMSINTNKSVCLRLGQDYNHACKNIRTSDGHEIAWSDTLKYLGIFIKSAKIFTCCLDNAKRSFYRAFNAVFGKVANAASESVVIELLKTKCLPTLYYGLEACPVSKKQYKSLNYVLHSTFRKIFKTKSQDIVNECMLMFNCPSAEETIHKRNLKFLTKYATADNLLCHVCQT